MFASIFESVPILPSKLGDTILSWFPLSLIQIFHNATAPAEATEATQLLASLNFDFKSSKDTNFTTVLHFQMSPEAEGHNQILRIQNGFFYRCPAIFHIAKPHKPKRSSCQNTIPMVSTCNLMYIPPLFFNGFQPKLVNLSLRRHTKLRLIHNFPFLPSVSSELRMQLKQPFKPEDCPKSKAKKKDKKLKIKN